MSKLVDGTVSAAITPYEFDLDGDPCVVTEIDFQRNGVMGETFFVLRFTYDGRELIATLFEYGVARWANPRTAVIDPADLTNHWRGDRFDNGLRAAIKARYDEIWSL